MSQAKTRPEVQVHLRSEMLLPIPIDEWPESVRKTGVARERAWLSMHFMVQQFAPIRGWVRLTVNRPEVGDDGSWKAEITWAELMRCKREIGYADRDAIEILPRDRDVVDVSNMRHLWLLPDMTAVPCIWRQQPPRRTPYRKPTAEEAAEYNKLLAEMEKRMGVATPDPPESDPES